MIVNTVFFSWEKERFVFVLLDMVCTVSSSHGVRCAVFVELDIVSTVVGHD